jgi:hypothetical protein
MYNPVAVTAYCWQSFFDYQRAMIGFYNAFSTYREEESNVVPFLRGKPPRR